MNSNNTTLPMSKEVDIVVFLKSNNDAVLCIKFYVKRPEVVKRSFLLWKHNSNRQNVCENFFFEFDCAKGFNAVDWENRFSQKYF